MAIVRLKHVHTFTDRHGRTRHYLRIPGAKARGLPGKPGSAEFMAAYYQGIAEASVAAAQVGRSKTIDGSFDALAVAWYESGPFRALKPITQSFYRNIVERLRKKHGRKPVALLDAVNVRRIMAELADRPTSANHMLRTLRLMMAFAVQQKMRADDPTRGIPRFKINSAGIPTWTEDEIALFEARYPSGSRERLALALLLYTGQRRADVVKMGRQHVRDGVISVRQQKTGAELEIALHPALRAEIALLPPGQMIFLLTERGAPFSAPGFSNWFVEKSREAGVPERRSPHGLRKAAGRRLAEAGCSAHQIMAVLGHKTLAEAERYTRAAGQKALARAAIAALPGADAEQVSQTRSQTTT